MNTLIATDLQTYLRQLVDENLSDRSDHRSKEEQAEVPGSSRRDERPPCPSKNGVHE
jgi:hypothetical protein